MHKRSGTRVTGHYRDRTWVAGHYRSGSIVEDRSHIFDHACQNREAKKSSNEGPLYWLYTGKVTFPSNCWWCGDEVYFHRDENGGCVLFDLLGEPWPIHPCWEVHKHKQEEASAGMLENYKKALRGIKVENYQYTDTVPAEGFDAFLIGCDFSRRVILNKDTPQFQEIFFRYLVYKIADMEYMRLMVPESALETLLKKPHIYLEVTTHKRGAGVVNFIKSLRFEDENTENSIKFTVKPEDYLQYKWVHQHNLSTA